MADANWVGIVLSQGKLVRKGEFFETYELDGNQYVFDLKKGTMIKKRKNSVGQVYFQTSQIIGDQERH